MSEIESAGTGGERNWRSRLLERATLGLGGLVALAGVAVLRRAPWLDRAAVAAATLLAADAWFDIVTSRGAAAFARATTEAVAVELPVALLCIWVARRLATPAARERNTLTTTHEQGVLQ